MLWSLHNLAKSWKQMALLIEHCKARVAQWTLSCTLLLGGGGHLQSPSRWGEHWCDPSCQKLLHSATLKLWSEISRQVDEHSPINRCRRDITVPRCSFCTKASVRVLMYWKSGFSSPQSGSHSKGSRLIRPSGPEIPTNRTRISYHVWLSRQIHAHQSAYPTTKLLNVHTNQLTMSLLYF